MKFTLESTEEEVQIFLQQRFARLDDVSARSVAESIAHLRQRRRGQPRKSERNAIYESVSKREDGATIDETIAASLTDEELADIDNHKRNYYRHIKRKHELLDPSRIYNENDFIDAVLAKKFNFASAIFVKSESKTKEMIISFLNHY